MRLCVLRRSACILLLKCYKTQVPEGVGDRARRGSPRAPGVSGHAGAAKLSRAPLPGGELTRASFGSPLWEHMEKH